MGPLDMVKLWWTLRGDVKAARSEVTMDGATKPGWKTTEFWLTLATQVPMIVGIFLGATNPITIGLGAAATIAYTLGRSWSKGNAVAVAQAALAAAAEAAKALPVVQPGAVDPK
jgi:hypothetical protein